MYFRLASCALVIWSHGIAAPAMADHDGLFQDVSFGPDTTGTTLTGSVTGRSFVVYRIEAKAGQRLDILLSADNPATFFNVYEPGQAPEDEALAISEILGPTVPEMNHFSADLSTTGVYSVAVYLYGNSAFDGETSRYRIDLSVTGEGNAEVARSVSVSSLQLTPDFWQVRADGGLKLRDAPSTQAAALTMLPNGLVLHNLGCQVVEERTWCNVASLTDPRVAGWAAAAFLVEDNSEAADSMVAMVPVQ